MRDAIELTFVVLIIACHAAHALGIFAVAAACWLAVVVVNLARHAA
jgi:hypothetical protein